MSMRLVTRLAAFQVLLVALSAIQAATLVPTEPDITFPVNVQFTTGMLGVTGVSPFWVELDGASPADLKILGSYIISAGIGPGGTLDWGTITLSGSLSHPTLGLLASGQLLSGTLTDFKFANGATDEFEFLFDVDSLAAELPFGVKGAVLITAPAAKSSFDGQFSDGWSALGDAHTFAVAVPTPTAAAAGLGMALGLAAWRRGGRLGK